MAPDLAVSLPLMMAGLQGVEGGGGGRKQSGA